MLHNCIRYFRSDLLIWFKRSLVGKVNSTVSLTNRGYLTLWNLQISTHYNKIKMHNNNNRSLEDKSIVLGIMHSNIETKRGLSLIKTTLQDALKWERNKFEALSCIELVLELHPENRTKGEKTLMRTCVGLKPFYFSFSILLVKNIKSSYHKKVFLTK